MDYKNKPHIKSEPTVYIRKNGRIVVSSMGGKGINLNKINELTETSKNDNNASETQQPE